MVRLVIDTDTGVDDAHAILMALAHPGARVEAITTVDGNVAVDKTTANACKILDVVGRDIPVYRGAERPLIARHPYAEYVHGQDGLGDSGYPVSHRAVCPEHAVNALVRLADQAPGELTLAAIGPLTNIALATCLDPDLPKKYKRLVVMGGAIRGQGNTTPLAEYNIHSDPEAAEIVFTAWEGVSLVSWETTLDHVFSAAQVDELLAIDTPRGEFFRRITTNMLGFVEQVTGQRGLPAPDFLAVAAAVEPEIVLQSEQRFMRVELQGQHSRGQTMVDWNGLLKSRPNANLVLKMDKQRLWELFQAALR